ncbi:MAG: thiosulfate oxidation carrier complex protein SoxZ [Helicobacteraceae bacterium]|jgi:sulfur-oxidizing protein SoxZ|nr:thiosulfate oxidation carrier complex protein SoxZ [Helicobacteraceae bacterium]
MKVRAKLRNGIVSVKTMSKHDMTTYDMAEKKTGDRNNANFITHIVATVKGETVFEASTSQFLSKNPILKFEFKGIGAKGDKVEMSWVDLKGNTGKGSSEIK